MGKSYHFTMCLSRGFYKYFYFEENLSLCRKINGISQMILYLHRRDRARPCPNLLYIPLRTAARAVPTVNQCKALYIINHRLHIINFNCISPPLLRYIFYSLSQTQSVWHLPRGWSGTSNIIWYKIAAGASPRPTTYFCGFWTAARAVPTVWYKL